MKSNRFRFERFGGTHHLKIQSAEDVLSVLDLDETHWVATSAPTSSLRCDGTFLALLDADGDGRLRAKDIQDGIRWLFDCLIDAEGVTGQRGVLSLRSLNIHCEAGRRIHSCATRMLTSLGIPEPAEISLEQIRRVKEGVENMPVTEGGAVLPEASHEGRVQSFIKDIIETIGGVAHKGGALAVSEEQLSQFVSEADSLLLWKAEGEPAEGRDRSEIMPLAGETPQAFEALEKIRAKIDEYFAQCAAVALNADWARQVPPRDESLNATDFRDPRAIRSLLEEAPLAAPKAEMKLELGGAINPVYLQGVDQARREALEPALRRELTDLTVQDWNRAKDFFAAFEAWIGRKPKTAVEALGFEKLRTLMDETLSAEVRRLIAQSRDTAMQLDEIRLVEKLALYQRYMLELVNNFVSFPYLYDPQSRAMFERGSLIMDGRRFNMAVKVQNRAEHSSLAQTTDTFILYAELSGRQDLPGYEIAVPVTWGSQGNLRTGKRGIFLDVDGRDWDARVVQIIDNPISLEEAILAPFKRIGSVITGKIEQITQSAGKKLEATTDQTFTQMQTVVKEGEPPPPQVQPQPQAGRGFLAGGLVAGGGLAIAAVGSALAYIAKVVAEKGPMILIGGIGGAILALLLPTTILALVKLRRRDLSGILEGAGWAINARMRMTRAQRRYFTQRPPCERGGE